MKWNRHNYFYLVEPRSLPSEKCFNQTLPGDEESLGILILKCPHHVADETGLLIRCHGDRPGYMRLVPTALTGVARWGRRVTDRTTKNTIGRDGEETAIADPYPLLLTAETEDRK